MPKAEAIKAEQLERDAEAHPDERTDLLFDAAAAWRSAGEPDNAIRLLTELRELGGESGCFARVDLADIWFGLGDTDRMNAELRALAHDPGLDVSHCELTADMLVEADDLQAAVRWYDRAIARMSADDIDELGAPDSGSNTMAKGMVRRRRDARRQLGLPADRLDDLVGPRPTARGVAGRQLLVFRRDELPEAQRRWPAVFTEPAGDYYASGERIHRDYRDAGLATIRLVPAKAADLAAFAAANGSSAEDAEVRTRFAAAADPAATIAWPPERNAACWCGSGTKYKKCCGRPAP